jgi:hypothetical protein
VARPRGNAVRGTYALTVTDIVTGWTSALVSYCCEDNTVVERMTNL